LCHITIIFISFDYLKYTARSTEAYMNPINKTYKYPWLQKLADEDGKYNKKETENVRCTCIGAEFYLNKISAPQWIFYESLIS
jgi:hypothetical protein